MNPLSFLAGLFLLLVIATPATPQPTAEASLQPVPYTDTTLTDPLPRLIDTVQGSGGDRG